ncbi:uncharacterized protein LOC108668895 [Hyalella azteca]|uniref:Uncharacterized protein LOC108668895 n=1 Tax=Hyalella azteca TaxID=294128 RepID=A0A8B7NDS0_HYAAZ|nr:uncharacterized protein LOC108668895 [Hyalella azteca]
MRILSIVLVVAVAAALVAAVPQPQSEEIAAFKVRVPRSAAADDEQTLLVRVKRQFGFLSGGRDRNSRERYDISTETVDNNRNNDMATGTAVLIKAGVMSIIIKAILAAVLGGGAAGTTTVAPTG